MKLFLVLSVFAIVFQGEAKTFCPPDSAWPVSFYFDPGQKGKKAGDKATVYLKQKPDNSLQRIGLEELHNYTIKPNLVTLGVFTEEECEGHTYLNCRAYLAFNKDYNVEDVGIVEYTEPIGGERSSFDLNTHDLLFKASDVGNDEHLYNFFDGEGKMLLDFSQRNTTSFSAHFKRSQNSLENSVVLKFLADETPPQYVSQQISGDPEARVYELSSDENNFFDYKHCEGCKLSERGENECFVEKSSSVGAHSESPRFKQSKGKARQVTKRARRHSNRH